MKTDAPSSNNIVKSKRIQQKKDMVEAVRKLQLPGATPMPSEASAMVPLGPGSEITEIDTSNKEVSSLEDGVHSNARKFNDHRLVAERKQKELFKLRDELKSLQLETSMLDKIQKKESEGSHKIARLEKMIQETMGSMDDKTHHRRQLEHMTKRLEETQLKVEQHIQSLEDTVNESINEYEEVKLLYRHLEAGKSKALHTRTAYEEQVEMERKERARTLGEKESEAKNAKRMEQWRLKRIEQRAEMAAELRGDLSIVEENAILLAIEQKKQELLELQAANQERAQEATDLENLFTQIKQVTGANSLTDIMDKFVGQHANKASLEGEKSAVESRLSHIKTLKAQAQDELRELKASGIGGFEINREVYTKMENDLLHTRNSLKVTKAACERLENVIGAIQQGVVGLYERLQPFRDVLDKADQAQLHRSGVQVLDSIAFVEIALSKMIEYNGQQGTSASAFGVYEAEDRGEEYADDSRQLWLPSLNDDPTLHENNIRVTSRMGEGRKVKQQPVHESEDEDSGPDRDESVDDMVPSRQFLKKCSDRQYSEVVRKKELPQHVKDEELESDATNAVTSDESNTLRKQQELSDRRLCGTKSRTGLPDGISVKDDAFTKSKAFLTQVPDFMKTS